MALVMTQWVTGQDCCLLYSFVFRIFFDGQQCLTLNARTQTVVSAL